MTERKKEILKAIVNEYIMTAEPVGSRTLARRYDFGVSPATIRNEMADLEEANYLEQPHRSAGRIPTDKGYRFYVDDLMELKKISQKMIGSIKENIISKQVGIQEIIQQTSQMLSDLTNYTALVLSPQLEESIFRHLQLISIAERKVLMVLVTDTGLIKNKIIDVPESISTGDLEMISRFLNERLSGLALNKIDKEAIGIINRELVNRISVPLRNLYFINEEISSYNIPENGKIYLGGTAHILEQPEFNDINKIKSVLKLLEQKQLLYNIMGDFNKKTGVEIMIGSENSFQEIRDCSFVVATYNLGGRPVGKIGVIGPTRMEYSNVIGTVKFMADILSEFLAKP
ncbi:heat-inducible transcription repressor HrcA [Orenia metallireducens]|jgi:heat-inducible transcriptional repressor|uniref:Heat-inducible transcription repressor HrcA n=1 Tax=Orenia metallireducens TaxID=1413210 RepID=A0A285G6P7_9FIRM|nr:heat-inducible transcriptional repressor HrcA [Orenia metallireducens]PRX28352.1 heat-inducible transcription repressor HrcA [Orenia metallireducens]SNY18764.1 heat-inducible transcription repressor HrcA [Orenia metallireducens]